MAINPDAVRIERRGCEFTIYCGEQAVALVVIPAVAPGYDDGYWETPVPGVLGSLHKGVGQDEFLVGTWETTEGEFIRLYRDKLEDE